MFTFYKLYYVVLQHAAFNTPHLLNILITLSYLFHLVISFPAEPPYANLLRGWYDADSFDEGTRQWHDKTTNNRHTYKTNGGNCWNVINFNFPNSQTHKVLSAGYCSGTPGYLRWPTNLFDHNEGWTFVHLTRYDDAGSYRGKGLGRCHWQLAGRLSFLSLPLFSSFVCLLSSCPGCVCFELR